MVVPARPGNLVLRRYEGVVTGTAPEYINIVSYIYH